MLATLNCVLSIVKLLAFEKMLAIFPFFKFSERGWYEREKQQAVNVTVWSLYQFNTASSLR